MLEGEFVLVLRDLSNDVFIHLGREASLDVHEGLQKHLLLEKFRLLLLMLLLKHLNLLRRKQRLACLEVNLRGKGQQ